jgi:hypothetical protein
MKNILIIAVISLALFSISAALSLWLQSNKKVDSETAEPKQQKKKDPEATSEKTEKTPAVVADMPIQPKTPDLGMKDRDDRTELRRLEMEVILQDMRVQREEFEKRSKQLTVELKALQAESEANDAQLKSVQQIEQKNKQKEVELDKKLGQVNKAESSSYVPVAGITDQMEPAKFAEMITSMADGGQLDKAARLLLKMKQSKVAKVLSELADPSLPTQLIERMRALSVELPTNTK